MSTTRLDVGITVYNNGLELPPLLRSLDAGPRSAGRILLVDGGSTDGGPDWVRRSFPAVEIHRLNGNLGPCAARNWVLRQSEAAWVLLLDGDCSLAPGCLDALWTEIERHPGAAVYTPRIVYAREPKRIYHDGGHAHLLGLLCLQNAHTRIEDAVAADRRPGAVGGTAMLVRREAALETLFDESYGFFVEDLDFSLRLRALGHRLHHVPEAIAYHHKPLPGERQNWPAGDLHRRRPALQNANRWRLLLAVCKTKTLARTSWLQLIYEMLALAHSVREGRAAQHLAGLARLVADLPRVLRARRAVQSRRVLPDERLFAACLLSWRPSVRRQRGARLAQALLERTSRAMMPTSIKTNGRSRKLT